MRLGYWRTLSSTYAPLLLRSYVQDSGWVWFCHEDFRQHGVHSLGTSCSVKHHNTHFAIPKFKHAQWYLRLIPLFDASFQGNHSTWNHFSKSPKPWTSSLSNSTSMQCLRKIPRNFSMNYCSITSCLQT